jgi:hypothetical protein
MESGYSIRDSGLSKSNGKIDRSHNLGEIIIINNIHPIWLMDE